jgi:GPN-loop GTPase
MVKKINHLILLAFNLDFYTEVQDLSYLHYHLDNDRGSSRLKGLNQALCTLIDEFSLVSFETLCVDDKKSMLNLCRVIDKANGYIFGGLGESEEESMMSAVVEGEGMFMEDIVDVEDRYVRERWNDDEEEEEEHEE